MTGVWDRASLSTAYAELVAQAQRLTVSMRAVSISMRYLSRVLWKRTRRTRGTHRLRVGGKRR